MGAKKRKTKKGFLISDASASLAELLHHRVMGKAQFFLKSMEPSQAQGSEPQILHLLFHGLVCLHGKEHHLGLVVFQDN